MYSIARRLWALIVIGGTVAVGLTTRNPGFIVITLIGGLLLPRFLGFHRPFGAAWAARGHNHGDPTTRMGACSGRGPWGWGATGSWEAWHQQAHQNPPAATPPASV
jgi:hypothetical protein